MIREGRKRRRKVQVAILDNGKVRVRLRRKIYEVGLDKILYVISILKDDKDFMFRGSGDVFRNLRKYRLIDEVFLCGVEGLW